MLMRFVILAFFGMCSLSAAAAEVNVYSSRKDVLIVPLLEQFEKQTGIEVNLITGKAGALMSRIQSEGQRHPLMCWLLLMLVICTEPKRRILCKQFKVNCLNHVFPRPYAIQK